MSSRSKASSSVRWSRCSRAVRRVRVDLQRDVRPALADAGDRLEVPAGLDLQLDAAIARVDVLRRPRRAASPSGRAGRRAGCRRRRRSRPRCGRLRGTSPATGPPRAAGRPARRSRGRPWPSGARAPDPSPHGPTRRRWRPRPGAEGVGAAGERRRRRTRRSSPARRWRRTPPSRRRRPRCAPAPAGRPGPPRARRRCGTGGPGEPDAEQVDRGDPHGVGPST